MLRCPETNWQDWVIYRYIRVHDENTTRNIDGLCCLTLFAQFKVLDTLLAAEFSHCGCADIECKIIRCTWTLLASGSSVRVCVCVFNKIQLVRSARHDVSQYQAFAKLGTQRTSEGDSHAAHFTITTIIVYIAYLYIYRYMWVLSVDLHVRGGSKVCAIAMDKNKIAGSDD